MNVGEALMLWMAILVITAMVLICVATLVFLTRPTAWTDLPTGRRRLLLPADFPRLNDGAFERPYSLQGCSKKRSGSCGCRLPAAAALPSGRV